MIVGEALKRACAGMTVKYKGVEQPVNFGYGDHAELLKWLAFMNKTPNKAKYPLIWYVIAPYTELNGELEVRSRLLIMQNTKPDWLNGEKVLETYTALIDPVWQKLKVILANHKFINVIGPRPDLKYIIKDEPNYGVDTDDIRLSENEFSRVSKKATQNISTDYVDGRIIGLHFKIKPQCII